MNRNIRCLLPGLVLLLLHGCGGGRSVQDGPPDKHLSQAEIERIPEPVPRVEKANPANQRPYSIAGKKYYPLASSTGFVQRGTASWYGKKFHGRRTANGEVYDMYALTAAHTRLPLPTFIRVRNLENGRSLVVRVNDRGPFSGNRIIDLSYAAARKLDIVRKGTANVEIQAIQQGHVEPPGQHPTRISKQRIYLQIAAFYNPLNANKMLRQLQAKTPQVLGLYSIQTERGTLYRLRAGPLKSTYAAQQLAGQLHNAGIQHTQIILR